MLQHPIATHTANAGAIAVCAVSPDHWWTVAVGIGALIYYGTYLYDWVAKKRSKPNASPTDR